MTHHEPYAPSIVTRARELLAGITPGLPTADTTPLGRCK